MVTFIKTSRATGKDGEGEKWSAGMGVPYPTLNIFDNMGDVRATMLIVTKTAPANESNQQTMKGKYK